MEKTKIYLETTIPSYLVARASRDLLIAAHQQVTRTWWDEHRGNYDLFVSEFVIAEIAFGEEAMAEARRSVLAAFPLLEVNESVRELTRVIIGSGILPPKATTDAAHIAVATIHQIDFLLTWNCRHINNAGIKRRMQSFLASQEYVLPTICTPEELMEDEP